MYANVLGQPPRAPRSGLSIAQLGPSYFYPIIGVSAGLPQQAAC